MSPLDWMRTIVVFFATIVAGFAAEGSALMINLRLCLNSAYGPYSCGTFEIIDFRNSPNVG